MFTISFFFCYYILSISVSSVKPTALKVYPHLLMDFFFKFELRSCEEDRKSILIFSSKHMHPPGPYFPARSEEAAHCGRFGTLGTNTHSKMARRRHGCVLHVKHRILSQTAPMYHIHVMNTTE